MSEATPCGPMGPSYACLKLGVGVYFRVLLRWWLGKKIVDIPAADSTTLCPFCSEPCDCYGDHIMCCRRVEFHSRHHAVVSALSHAMESAGLRVTNEVTVTGKKRPADIFISQWSDNGPDVTVTHPLDPSLGLSFSAARSALCQRGS